MIHPKYISLTLNAFRFLSFCHLTTLISFRRSFRSHITCAFRLNTLSNHTTSSPFTYISHSSHSALHKLMMVLKYIVLFYSMFQSYKLQKLKGLVDNPFITDPKTRDLFYQHNYLLTSQKTFMCSVANKLFSLGYTHGSHQHSSFSYFPFSLVSS